MLITLRVVGSYSGIRRLVVWSLKTVEPLSTFDGRETHHVTFTQSGK